MLIRLYQMYLTAKPPNMLPTQILTGVNVRCLTPTRAMADRSPLGIWTNTRRPETLDHVDQPFPTVIGRPSTDGVCTRDIAGWGGGECDRRDCRDEFAGAISLDVDDACCRMGAEIREGQEGRK